MAAKAVIIRRNHLSTSSDSAIIIHRQPRSPSVGIHTIGGIRRRRLLEVGSAHGWFLDAAASEFEELVGIEPDDRVRKPSANERITVRTGYFPDVIAAGETFDVIDFNDAFEHIPRAPDVARAIADHLVPSGIAIVRLPVTNGFFYLAKLLARARIRRPFERLWQCGYPSSPLYYFRTRD